MSPSSATFPSFLRPAFEAEELAQMESTIAVVDPAHTILWVNPAWMRFATENGAHVPIAPSSSYLDGISPPLRHFYRAVFENALLTGQVFEQDYECSTPSKKRLFHFRVLPVESRGLLLEHSMVAEGPHGEPTEEPLEERYLDASQTILQCSNCRRVRRPDTNAWDRVPRWVERSDPRTSHVICPPCVGFYWGLRS